MDVVVEVSVTRDCFIVLPSWVRRCRNGRVVVYDPRTGGLVKIIECRGGCVSKTKVYHHGGRLLLRVECDSVDGDTT